jgi:hypothetical protein
LWARSAASEAWRSRNSWLNGEPRLGFELRFRVDFRPADRVSRRPRELEQSAWLALSFAGSERLEDLFAPLLVLVVRD